MLHARLGRFHHNCALHTLFLKLAAHIIGAADITGKVIRIGRAPAAAIKFSETAAALFFRVDITTFKFVTNLRLRDSVVYIAQQKLLVADKLMAGIEISPRRDRQILRAGAAAG